MVREGGEGGEWIKKKLKLLKFLESWIKLVIANFKKNMVMCPLEPINKSTVVLKGPLSLLV